jgi:adenylylsulfate kinase
MSHTKSANITRQEASVTRAQREAHLGQRGAVVWFTGLSASGKSTVAKLVDRMLHERGRHSCVLDGDNIRFGLNSDLGFSPRDRNENIRRIGEVAKLFATNGTLALTAFISPYRAGRDRNRAINLPGDFIEVFVDCALEVCEARDPRGLYAKARAEEIPEFTGISAPYETPENAEIVLHTGREDEAQSAARVVAYLEQNGYLRAPDALLGSFRGHPSAGAERPAGSA